MDTTGHRARLLWAQISMFLMALLIGVVALLSHGCERGQAADAGASERPVVVATTTMLTDLARQIGEPEVEVVGIMQPGGDPHLYQPTPADARRIAQSDLVITSGLHLEGWIDDLVRNAGGVRPVVVASDGVDAIRMEESPGGVDPHFWFDLPSWQIAAGNVGSAIEAQLGADTPEGKAVASRLDAYQRRTKALDGWVRDQLATIPEAQRVLVTSHDAFGYFARRYQLDVVALQGISTEEEASQRDVANVVEAVRRRGAPAVFVETSVNPSLVEQVARETGAKVAGPLYSDSIGPLDGPASTFHGTVRENTRMMVEALGGRYEPFDLDARAQVTP